MWQQFFQKWYFCSKTEKLNIGTEFHMLELLGYSSKKQKNITIQFSICISLCMKFELKQAISNF